ncbi:MAG: OadG family protein [Ruminococcaceae bacterium]|nr:OadG family protein [Oscillospiraceae bacterium]
MIDQLKQSDIMSQGVFVALTGLVIVFLVLSLFFLTIKLMQKAGSRKNK